MFKNLRILFLLCVLLVVAVSVYRDKNQDWSKPIYVALYPINAEKSADVDRYIQTLKDEDFKEIQNYIKSQSANYGKSVDFYLRIGDEVKKLPPDVPRNASVLQAMIWSLKFRFYALQNASDVGVPTNLKLFLMYYDANKNKVLKQTSTTLQNGRIGIVHLYGIDKKTKNNNVVITHESLHGFGASDKYNLNTGQPIEPIGLANPAQTPLYPQSKAELMAVHKAISPTKFEMARLLDDTVINQVTAYEIGWLAQDK